MYFIPRTETDASGAKQLLNSIAEDGEVAEEKMEKDVKESEETEAEAAPKAETALQTNDESSVILGSLIADGDSAEAALNSPNAPEQPVQKAPEAKKDEEAIDFDASDVQIRFVDLSIAQKKPTYKGLAEVRKGDVAGTYLNGLLNDGAEAEQNIQDTTPEGAVAKQARDAALAQKQTQEEDGQFYDDSEVQIQFVGQNLDKVNDELSKYNKIDKLGNQGFLIEGELALKNFTYFPQHK